MLIVSHQKTRDVRVPPLSGTKFGHLVNEVITRSLQNYFFFIKIKMNGLTGSRYLWTAMVLQLVFHTCLPFQWTKLWHLESFRNCEKTMIITRHFPSSLKSLNRNSIIEFTKYLHCFVPITLYLIYYSQ